MSVPVPELAPVPAPELVRMCVGDNVATDCESNSNSQDERYNRIIGKKQV